MKVAIMQPYLFPYLGYFQLIHAVDKFVVYDDVAFIKKGWINRNTILVNGKAFLFAIPLANSSQNKLINQVELVPGVKWETSFLRTLEFAYKKAPNYSAVLSLVSDIILSGKIFINELALLSIETIKEYLDIKTKLVTSSSIYGNSHLKAAERIIDICKKEKAEQYINPIGGMQIYSNATFISYGLKLNFMMSDKISYPQFNGEFVPNLSIIDVLMFNNKETCRHLLGLYQLV